MESGWMYLSEDYLCFESVVGVLRSSGEVLVIPFSKITSLSTKVLSILLNLF
jgi:hypothetical protein